MNIRIINAKEVRQLMSMSECIDVMSDAMISASTGTVSVIPRHFTSIIDDSTLLGLMPGSSEELNVFGVKLISFYRSNPQKSLPAIQGFVALFNFENGKPLAIIDAAELTAIRTGAASGLATKLLSREDSRTCGILGTGVQATAHLEAICAVRSIEEILIWGRDFDKASAFVEQHSTITDAAMRATKNPEDAGSCDIVCTVTGSSTPILQGSWVEQGAHINLVGAHTLSTREADTELIINSNLYVDLFESAENEAGDFMIPVEEGKITKEHILGEIGELLLSQIAGRQDSTQITVYKSLGIVAQDLFAASYVYKKSEESNSGRKVDF